ncbi:hypothetical protein CYD26_24275 [Pseudomonas sp. FFUP_PS_473]|uniref:hypothetical protein n=1 Tax=Pseudomonas sp. FFUP_PS_473 TaxID=2060418 RepID=UPI000C7B5D31|nr:hypothetical protein [Pseudomonas sp. FFUP_PS_473]PLP85956.1 hypothetical protein CYD26_24275 [Pseudomonas sp. FFUP_PS_473]
MIKSWRDRFEQHYVVPEKKISLDEILEEAQEAYLGWLAASLTAFHGHFSEDQVDNLDRIFQGESRIRAIAKDCYDYAINGRFRLAKDGQEHEQMNDDWVCLAILVRSARPGIEEFNLVVRGRPIGVPAKLEQLLLHAQIRALLDFSTVPEFDEDSVPTFFSQPITGYLTLKEIALLGQMSERAVRNAAQPTAADRLRTRKEKTQTVVDADEALRWLKGRRGFIASRAD